MKLILSVVLLTFCLPFIGYGAASLSEKDVISKQVGDQKKIHRAFVADWDDTIFGTEATKEIVAKEGLRPERAEEFAPLDQQAYSFFSFLINKKDPVYLISNGGSEWIRGGAKAWLPKTESLFCKNNYFKDCVIVISAKDYFEGLFPNLKNQPMVEYQGSQVQTSLLWKIYAFSAYLSGYQSVFSIGDGIAEKQAMINLFSMTPSFHVTLPPKPNIQQLIYNLAYIQSVYDHILSASVSKTLTGCDMYYIYNLYESLSKGSDATENDAYKK